MAGRFLGSVVEVRHLYRNILQSLQLNGDFSCFSKVADPAHFNADPDPDSASRSDADPEPAFHLMRIRNKLFT